MTFFIRNFIIKYFPKTAQYLLNEGISIGKEKENTRQQESFDNIRNIETTLLLGEKIIAISNEWSDPVVGFYIDVFRSDNGKGILPVIVNAMTGKITVSFSVLVKYEEGFLKALFKLNPYERWALVSKSSYYTTLVEKEDPSKLTASFEEFQKKLEAAERTHKKTYSGIPVELVVAGYMTRKVNLASNTSTPNKSPLKQDEPVLMEFPNDELRVKYGFLPEVVKNYPGTMTLSQKDQWKTILEIIDFLEGGKKTMPSNLNQVQHSPF